MNVPPGWYPVDQHSVRYWDGRAWTPATQPIQPQVQNPWASAPLQAPGSGPAAWGVPSGPVPHPPMFDPYAPTERRQSEFLETLRRTRSAVVSDLGVNWISYLGALLLFGGLFGFVVFSFDAVPSPLRPLCEAALPAVLFAAAWFLRARKVPLVAEAVALGAAALVPIALVASLVDDAPVPPDLHGYALSYTAAGLAAGTALLYALLSLRTWHSLRYLVAPAVWLAAGLLGHAAAGTLPRGRTVAYVDEAHAALMLLAVALGLVAARAWSTHRLSAPTLRTALPGALLTGSLLFAAALRGEVQAEWFALGALALGILATASAVSQAAPWRPLLQGLGALSTYVALLLFARSQDWAPEERGLVLVGLAGVVLLGSVLAAWRGLSRDWSLTWGSTSAIMMLHGTLRLLLDPPGVRPSAAAYALLAGCAALAALLGADAYGRPGLRRVGAGLLALSAALVAVAAGADVNALAYTGCAAAVLLAALASLSERSGRSDLAQSLLWAAWTALAGAVLAAASGSVFAEVVLLALALLLLATFDVSGVTALGAAAPLVAYAAWLVYLERSGLNGLSLRLVPAGLMVLLGVTLWRSGRRRAGLPSASRDVSLLEWAGLILLAAGPLVEVLTDGALYALLGIFLGVLVAAWGALTRVRRRVLAGTGMVLLSALLAAAVLLTGLWPRIDGPLVWLAVAGAGALALALAAGIEKARTGLGAASRRWEAAVEGWE